MNQDRIRCFDALLDSVYPTLNALHGISYSRRFWALLLYRYLSKCLIVNEAGLPRLEAPPSVPNDEAVLGPRAGEAAAPMSSRREPRGVVRAAAHALGKLTSLPAIAGERKRLRRLWRTPMATSRTILGDFHYYHKIVQHLPTPAALLNPAAIPMEVQGDPSKREELRAAAAEVDSPLTRLALDWLPCWYVEELASRIAAIRLVNSTSREFHASFFASPEVRFYVARHIEAGSRLSIYQHAATYGEIEHDVHHYIESRIADRFCTWGWQREPSDVPFLALRLIKPAGEEIRRHGNASRWIYLNVRQPLPWLLELTLAEQDRFFALLTEEKARRVTVRPRVNKGGSPLVQVSDRARGRVAVDDGRTKWNELVSRAELVILDSFPSTAFMECVTAGVPVIAIVPEATVFTPLAAGFYEEAYRSGVLHRSPESAAAFLNDLTVSAWWRSVRRQRWFPEYVQTFCRT